MSYQILYDPEKKHKFPPLRKKTGIWQYITAAVLLALIIGMLQLEALQSAVADFLVPGEYQETASAFHALMEEVKRGEGVRDVFSRFCQEILVGSGREVF